MRALQLPLTARFLAFTAVLVIALALFAALVVGSTPVLVGIPFVVFAVLSLIGVYDLIQKRHAILRNYPLTAHLRFILEEIRPEIRQYFLESEKDGTPFSRDKRAIVYQRAKRALDKRPFGTQYDVYRPGYEWLHTRWRPARLRGAVSRRHRRPRLRQALFGFDLQYLGDEFRRAEPQRHPRLEHRRQAGRFRARHRRGRL